MIVLIKLCRKYNQTIIISDYRIEKIIITEAKINAKKRL